MNSPAKIEHREQSRTPSTPGQEQLVRAALTPASKEHALALLNEEAHKQRSEALELLAREIKKGRISSAHIVEFPANSCIPAAAITNSRSPESSLFIKVSGEATLANSVKAYSLHAGYPLAAAKEGVHATLSTGANGARFVEISRAEFAALQGELPFVLSFQEPVALTHRPQEMPFEARELLRNLRDQNILALVLREEIPEVTGPKGILSILNPERCELGAPYEGRSQDRIVTTAQQSWAVLRKISTLAAWLNKDELLALARQARGTFDRPEFAMVGEPDKAGLALHLFASLVKNKESAFVQERLPAVAAVLDSRGLDSSQRETLLSRMLEVLWLMSLIHKQGTETPFRPPDQRLATLLGELVDRTGGSFPLILHRTDRWIERLFEAVKKRDPERLTSIDIQRYPAQLYLNTQNHCELPETHTSRQALVDLQQRLERGEISAVGGSSYSAMRYPRPLLNEIARGNVPAVVFDGTHVDAITHTRARFGTSELNPLILEPCNVVELQAPYGSFKRSCVFFRDGRSAFVTSHFGQSRQLANAGALLLYHTADEQRMPMERLHLVSGVRDAQRRVSESLLEVLERSAREDRGRIILGEEVVDSRILPTQAIILLHPGQLRDVFGDGIELQEYKAGCLGPMRIGYIRNPSRGLTRLVTATVGGHGLYGDTAGLFTKSVFDPQIIPNVIPHLLFSATGGGFTGTGDLESFRQAGVVGLPNVPPDGFLMPTEAIYDDFGVMPMQTLLHLAKKLPERVSGPLLQELEAALDAAKVFRYSRHYCVSHPGDETHRKLTALINRLMISSVDVEGGPIQRAMIEIMARYPNATFTPIYNFSDDPRSATADRYKTLAYGGPLHHNVQADSRLNRVLAVLLELSFACR